MKLILNKTEKKAETTEIGEGGAGFSALKNDGRVYFLITKK